MAVGASSWIGAVFNYRYIKVLDIAKLGQGLSRSCHALRPAPVSGRCASAAASAPARRALASARAQLT